MVKTVFFLTALGTVFHLGEFEYAEEVNQFMASEDVKYIYIVNDLSCAFIQGALQGENVFESDSMNVLLDIADKRKVDISNADISKEKASVVAKANIYRQAHELTEPPFLGNKIEDGEIKLVGLIYDRDEERFTEVPTVF